MEQIIILQKEVDDLRKLLHDKEDELFNLKREWVSNHKTDVITGNDKNLPKTVQYGDKLPKWAIVRYSRQILLPEIGVVGQERICAAKVLIVGAGGLGCPAGVYLAGAGVGEIGIIDYDTVDITNIHRQFLHTESDQNLSKVESAAMKLKSINSNIHISTYNVQLNSQNAMEIASKYDIVLDCTDNVPTRYLLNDLCVLNKIPLISGSALKMEGQLTMYGYRAEKNSKEMDSRYYGPCYRCIFPSPPPAETVGSCSANGVAGPVPGAIGALQALEAIKYIVGQTQEHLLVERMLLFDGDDITFRTVKLRPRNPDCVICSDSPKITQLVDYELFCNAQAKEKDLNLQILPQHHRITAKDLGKYLIDENLKQRHLLVDVRSEAEFRMCHIDGSTNYPIEKLYGNYLNGLIENIEKFDQVTFVCRRGNDSQIAVQKLMGIVEPNQLKKIKDLIGGLHSWAQDVDDDFPVY